VHPEDPEILNLRSETVSRLANNQKTQMEKQYLAGYPDLEKGAYLGAIASIATADRQATGEELEHLDALSAAAGLQDQQAQMIRRAATELGGAELNHCLDVLKNSELRFSLVADCIAFAEADGTVTEEERERIGRMATYLGINDQQFSLLDQFARQARQQQATPEQAAQPQFLRERQLDTKMEEAGMNTSGFLKGLAGVAGPLLLAGMLAGGRRRHGGMFGGGRMGGGLGSLTGMFGGGGFRRSGFGRRGGLLGGLFGF